MSREMILTLTLTFDNAGRLDYEVIEANLNRWLQHGVSEGTITPDDEDFTALTAWDLTPGTPPPSPEPLKKPEPDLLTLLKEARLSISGMEFCEEQLAQIDAAIAKMEATPRFDGPVVELGPELPKATP